MRVPIKVNHVTEKLSRPADLFSLVHYRPHAPAETFQISVLKLEKARSFIAIRQFAEIGQIEVIAKLQKSSTITFTM